MNKCNKILEGITVYHENNRITLIYQDYPHLPLLLKNKRTKLTKKKNHFSVNNKAWSQHLTSLINEGQLGSPNRHKPSVVGKAKK